MDNSLKAKIIVAGLTCAFTIGLATAVSNEPAKPGPSGCYIDISDGKIPYVPRSTEFVRINGQVKRIVKFAATISKEEKDCKCPQCCNGSCYVIIFTDSVILNKPIIILGIIWVSCT